MKSEDQGDDEIRILTDVDEIAAAVEARRVRLAALGLAVGSDVGVVFCDEHIKVTRDAVSFPSGALGTFLRLEERSAAAGISGVVILCLAAGKVVLRRVFRHPTRSWEWELPRGFLHDDSPERTAAVELEEEAGFRVREYRELGDVKPNTGLFATKARICFVVPHPEPVVPHPEDTECLGEIRLVGASEIWSMIADGEIEDGFTLSAVCLAAAKGLLPGPKGTR